MITTSNVPPLAVTLGDPSGVGPEITVKAWAAIGQDHPFVVYGDAEALLRAAGGTAPVTRVNGPENWAPHSLCVIDVPAQEPAQPGNAQPSNASAIVKSLDTAVAHTQAGMASALVSAGRSPLAGRKITV